MRVSATGLAAERLRMDVISSNIANVNSQGTAASPPYQRQIVDLEGDENGVRVQSVRPDNRAFVVKNEPDNPNADAQGNVYYSNIEPIEEMVNMLSASRAYEANIAAFNTAKGMMKNALDIGKA